MYSEFRHILAIISGISLPIESVIFMSNAQNQSMKPNVFAALDKKVADDNAAEKISTQTQGAQTQGQMEAAVPAAAAVAQQGDSGSTKPAQQGDAVITKA